MRLNKRALVASLLAGTLLAATPADAFDIGGLLGGGAGPKATLELQVLQQAQLLEQVMNQLKQIEQGMAMLEGFSINTAGDVFMAGAQLQQILREAENIIAKHGQVTGYINDLYPEEFDRNTTAGQLAELARRQHAEGRQRQIDAAQIQAQVFMAMEDARLRDRDLMNESAAAPGVTAAVQATNQLVGGLNSDVRSLQMATIAHQRTVEDRFLREDARGAMALAKDCESLERMPVSWQPEYCKK